MSLEDTRERIWVLQQPVKGLVANLGKGAVGRGEEGEGGSSVQDVGGGAVVEGGSEGGHKGGEAVVGGQGLVQAERARGGLGGDYSWGDTCVFCKCSRNLVLVWAKNLPDSAVQHIVDQVDLPAKHQQLLRLRLLVCQHKGQEKSHKNTGLHL